MDLDLIIPTYNRGHLLNECLKSVFRATRLKDMNIAVFVVDNGSTDNTKDVVQPFLERSDLACKYLCVARPGKSAALNEALTQTDSEMVGLIDDDEQIDKAWFEVAYREFSTDPTLDYIGGPYHPNWEIPPPQYLPPISVYGSGLGIVLRPERVEFTPKFYGILMGGNIVIRRSTLEKVLPYPEKLGKIGSKIRSGEDEFIHHRLLRIGARGVSVPDLIIYHWVPAERLTKRYYRKWAIGKGIGEGYGLRERGFAVAGMFGIPRYKFGAAVRGLRSMLIARSQQERLMAELSILDCFATLYGRLFYGRVDAGSLKSLFRRFVRS
jgi:glycosyltransferase involved in cell wall biosynthesis